MANVGKFNFLIQSEQKLCKWGCGIINTLKRFKELLLIFLANVIRSQNFALRYILFNKFANLFTICLYFLLSSTMF